LKLADLREAVISPFTGKAVVPAFTENAAAEAVAEAVPAAFMSLLVHLSAALPRGLVGRKKRDKEDADASGEQGGEQGGKEGDKKAGCKLMRRTRGTGRVGLHSSVSDAASDTLCTPAAVRHMLSKKLRVLRVAWRNATAPRQMPPPPCPHFLLPYSQRCRKGTYVDVVMGKNGNGTWQAIQAHRLLCLASLSSEKVVELLKAGRNFVVRHSVGCANRKHCCSPYHFSPGTPKDNWDDYTAVRQPACNMRSLMHSILCTTHFHNPYEPEEYHLERTYCRQQVKDARKERFRALRLKRKWPDT